MLSVMPSSSSLGAAGILTRRAVGRSRDPSPRRRPSLDSRRMATPEPLRTIFHDRHVALGARMTEFGGWDMPLQYPSGTIQEHLAVRGGAGVFDVSHMGRFVVRGPSALAFLQRALTNNAEALDGRPTHAQYTLI